MRAVNISIGHDDHFMITKFGEIEFLSNCSTDRNHKRPNLGVREHLIEPRSFNVQNLPTQRQNRLRMAVPSLLCRAAGGIALDNEKFRFFGCFEMQSASFPGKVSPSNAPLRKTVSRAAFAARRAFAVKNTFETIAFASAGCFSKNSFNASFTTASVAVSRLDGPQAILRLPFKLRISNLHGNNGDQPLAHIVARKIFFFFLQITFRARIGVLSNASRPNGIPLNGFRRPAYKYYSRNSSPGLSYRQRTKTPPRRLSSAVPFRHKKYPHEPVLFLREIFYERKHAAFKIKTVENGYRRAAIEKIDADALGKVCLLAQPLHYFFVVKLNFRENLRIGGKRHFGPRSFRGSYFFYLSFRLSPLVFLDETCRHRAPLPLSLFPKARSRRKRRHRANRSKLYRNRFQIFLLRVAWSKPFQVPTFWSAREYQWGFPYRHPPLKPDCRAKSSTTIFFA